MENKKSRPYSSVIRRQQALETRNRIADAAEDLITANGYDHVTINAISRHAGVATQTVYAVFGSKAGILVYLLIRRMRAHVKEDADMLLPGPATGKAGKTGEGAAPAEKTAAQALAGVARLRNAQQQNAIDSLGGFAAIYPELHELVLGGDQARRRMTREYLENLQSDERDLFLPESRQNSRKLDLIMALTDTTLHHYLSKMVSDWDDELYERVLTRLLRFVIYDLSFD